MLLYNLNLTMDAYHLLSKTLKTNIQIPQTSAYGFAQSSRLMVVPLLFLNARKE